MAQQREYVDAIRTALATSEDVFRRVYRQTFVIARPAGSKVLPLDQALDFWRLLLSPPRSVSWSSATTPWLEWWLEYLESKWKKSVSKDMWDQTLLFVLSSRKDETMSFWSEVGSWPGVIDDFVIYVRNQRAAREVEMTGA